MGHQKIAHQNPKKSEQKKIKNFLWGKSYNGSSHFGRELDGSVLHENENRSVPVNIRWSLRSLRSKLHFTNRNCLLPSKFRLTSGEYL